MAKFGGTLRNVLVWTYFRGTIPYDILCALIILFIFLTPRSCFFKKPGAPERNSGTHQVTAGAAQAAIPPAAGELSRK